MLTKEQKDILTRSKILCNYLSEDQLYKIADGYINVETLTDNELLEFLEIANALYRGGEDIINDADYDFIFLAELKSRHPDHPFIQSVESEAAFSGKTVELPVRMLSTEKAYSKNDLNKWLDRVKKAASDISIEFETIQFRVTAKLDGFAAYDDGKKLYTRGDGKKGTDITRVFDRGLIVSDNGARGQGAGEIVVSKTYFKQYLSPYFENARNFQASVVKEKELEEHALKAIQDKAAMFYPFALLPAWEGIYKDFMRQYDEIIETAWRSVDFLVDGVIIEITDDELKNYMGSTRHHHRWQIALKENAEKAEVQVLNVSPQTSRSGRINPVANIEPIRLSGAMIHKASAHHYGMVKAKGIGKGTIIELTRSGEVIPKIVKVLHAASPDIPTHCPSCGTALFWDNDFLFCPNNIECPAQISHTIEHFFKTLGNNDGFGPSTIKKLYVANIRTIPDIYQLNVADFIEIGFGPKQSENLYTQLIRSRTEKIEDWRFLSAFGIYRMGGGNCEKLLANFHLKEIFELTSADIMNVEGFAKTTADIVEIELRRIHDIFNIIYKLGFNLEITPLISELKESGEMSPISGKQIVFTGTMVHGSRADMCAEAKKLGAKTATSVTGKTDFLVTGEKVGASKISSAKDKGIKVLTENEYLALLQG